MTRKYLNLEKISENDFSLNHIFSGFINCFQEFRKLYFYTFAFYLYVSRVNFVYGELRLHENALETKIEKSIFDFYLFNRRFYAMFMGFWLID